MTTQTDGHEYPDTVNLTDLERLVEAYEKAAEQIQEMAALMQTAFLIALEPLKDRVEALEAKYNLRPARAELIAATQEEETPNE